MPNYLRINPSQLAIFIRERRRKYNLSQAELAELLTRFGHPCTESAVSHWEKDRSMPPIDDPKFMAAISLALRTSPSEILKETGISMDITPQTSQEVAAKLAPDVLQLIKEAEPQDIKKLEAVIRAVLTEIE